MKPWQKIVHFLTAVLLAVTTARFVSAYDLFDIPYATALCFAVVFSSYLLISKKYDPILSALFFSITLFIFVKSFSINKVSSFETNQQNKIKNQLLVAMSLAKTEFSHQRAWPTSIQFLNHTKINELAICSKDCPPSEHAQFWLQSNKPIAHDKEPVFWYINENFDLYIKQKDNSSVLINSEAKP